MKIAIRLSCYPYCDSWGIQDFTSSFALLETNFDLGRDGTGTIKASADASTGELKAYTSADNRLPPEDTSPDLANVSRQNVSATIGDRIWINEPIPVAGIPVALTLNISGSTLNIAGSGSLAPITDIYQDIFGSITLLPNGDSAQLVYAAKTTQNGDSMDATTVSLFFDLTPDISFIDVGYTLNVIQTNYNYQGEIDYFNTTFAGITLPEGFTFSSESGQFLSEVPLPATVWLFGSGLLGLIGVARRKAA